MSLRVLAAGVLIADPQRREGAKGQFAIATIRAGNGEESVLVSVVAFGDEAGRLLEFVKGDALAVSGRARLTKWTGRDGVEKHGISLVAEQIAAAKPRARPAAAGPRRQAAVIRRPHSPSQRPAHSPGPLLNDGVDDLWSRGEP